MAHAGNPVVNEILLGTMAMHEVLTTSLVAVAFAADKSNICVPLAACILSAIYIQSMSRR